MCSSWDDDDDFEDDSDEGSMDEADACKECGGDSQGSDCDDCTEPLCSGCNVTGSNMKRRCSGCEAYRGMEAEAARACLKVSDESVQVLLDGKVIDTIARTDAACAERAQAAVAEHSITVGLGEWDTCENIQRTMRKLEPTKAA